MAGKAVFLCCISAWIWVPRRANFFQGHDRQPNAQAVDLGTSACKFLLVDETGKVCNQVSREYPLSMPHTGWSEQDPSSWWQACLDGIPALLEVYATTLHYAPCHTDPANGFKVLVALPKGTNTDKPNMPIKGGDDAYLWACSVTARATSAPTSPRAKFCLWPPVLSAASASLPSPRWAASTAMC
ncbi:MAG TPA: DUF4867 family protein [Gemmiger qucibialis]|uniref:DUF4867 family protein n=1 Tax=Gemmiger qucibialis TaxID=2997294 RepID=UPI0022DF9505|nr:DUF4867 family protein [Gemmiger qucibialis]HRM28177.1 DUF4867 family protein [Gemmiger qucibialis]